MTRYAHEAASRRQTTLNTRSCKTPSAELVRLEIEADDCPQVLLRVLGLVARDGTIPVTIESMRIEDGIAIAIELDGLGTPARQTMADRIAGYPAVRKVSVAGRSAA